MSNLSSLITDLPVSMLSFSFFQDEKNQIMKSNVWLRMVSVPGRFPESGYTVFFTELEVLNAIVKQWLYSRMCLIVLRRYCILDW